MMKKLLSTMLMAVMLVTVLPCVTMAADTLTYDPAENYGYSAGNNKTFTQNEFDWTDFIAEKEALELGAVYNADGSVTITRDTTSGGGEAILSNYLGYSHSSTSGDILYYTEITVDRPRTNTASAKRAAIIYINGADKTTRHVMVYVTTDGLDFYYRGASSALINSYTYAESDETLRIGWLVNPKTYECYTYVNGQCLATYAGAKKYVGSIPGQLSINFQGGLGNTTNGITLRSVKCYSGTYYEFLPTVIGDVSFNKGAIDEAISSGSITATASFENPNTLASVPAQRAVIIVAVYDENKKLLDVKFDHRSIASGENATLTATADVAAEAHLVKAFIWESLETLKPIDGKYTELGE